MVDYITPRGKFQLNQIRGFDSAELVADQSRLKTLKEEFSVNGKGSTQWKKIEKKLKNFAQC
jgi:hypothetical protein